MIFFSLHEGRHASSGAGQTLAAAARPALWTLCLQPKCHTAGCSHRSSPLLLLLEPSYISIRTKGWFGMPLWSENTTLVQIMRSPDFATENYCLLSSFDSVFKGQGQWRNNGHAAVGTFTSYSKTLWLLWEFVLMSVGGSIYRTISTCSHHKLDYDRFDKNSWPEDVLRLKGSNQYIQIKPPTVLIEWWWHTHQ